MRVPLSWLRDYVDFDLPPERLAELSMTSDTPWGRLTHLAPTVRMSETPARWDKPTTFLNHDTPTWEGN